MIETCCSQVERFECRIGAVSIPNRYVTLRGIGITRNKLKPSLRELRHNPALSFSSIKAVHAHAHWIRLCPLNMDLFHREFSNWVRLTYSRR